MPTPFLITLPADKDDLRDEIVKGLMPYAEVQAESPTFGLNEIKMIVEIVAGVTGILANGAAIATFLLLLKDRYKKTGQPSGIQIGQLGGPSVPLEEADEASLHRIIGLDSKENLKE